MQSEIWEYDRGFYKVYLENAEIKRKITSWDGCKETVRQHCHYFHPDGKIGWDIIFPGKYYDKIARLLGLPLKAKNQNRVDHGRKLGEKAATEDRLGLKTGKTMDLPIVKSPNLAYIA